ncbi:MAG TPA: BrnT family toxin [Dehalococcoidia bacterium]|nr:BrnT family toxin [Dehalococcoidia bacterium]
MLESKDARRNYGETRIVAVGATDGVAVTIVYTTRGEVRRIISARRSKRDERRACRQAYPG